ncbi:hypothetical protein QNH39_23905 [Neobacillus novalis]|uniref:Uncharacterized protein n=1 Tax=Neobacillus novalis TaxID=220687 RepID=A0AA95SAP0_9BACI|nr:hypothetical protein [Neobacillus novalis]WHY85619.1 hypothetical protein QNH39_23905 [Neobacillus novalis]
MKLYGKIILVLMLSVSLIGLSGCFGKEKESNAADKKVAATKTADKATKENKSTDQENPAAKSTDQDNKTTKSTDQDNKTAKSTDQTSKTSQNTDTSKQASKNDSIANKTTPSNNNTDKTAQNTDSSKKPAQNTTPAKTNPSKGQTVGDKEITDFVLANTRIVQISNISRRTNEKYPNLGPFFVVRGMDLRGEASEVWIKDMKIFEMVTQANK